MYTRGYIRSIGSMASEFFAVYRQYRRFHGRLYALRRAWHIAVQGSPF